MLKYRPDIDGLRALAILPVVFFHASPELFPGGFIGVDIFFVISGYLITSIILKDAVTGTFTYKDFYQRRINRIFPALFIIFFFVMALGWFFLMPHEFKNLGKHIYSGSLFVSNFTSMREAGYFNVLSDQKPLLHLWSLAIEEQYYLLFPTIVLIGIKNKKKMFGAIVLILIISFSINIYRTPIRPEKVFYEPYPRIWELLLGSVLAFSEFNNFKLKGNLLSFLGLTLLLAGFVFIDKASSFPGWWALLPCLGTVLLISGGPEAWINKKILSHKAPVFIGLISYPLYLWHWPLLSFGHIFEQENQFYLVILSFILAFLTYRFIESPLKNQAPASKRRNAFVLLCLLGCFGLSGFLIYKGTIPSYISDPRTEMIMNATTDWDFPGKEMKSQFIEIEGLRIYHMGPKEETVLFLGDSHAEQLHPRVKVVLEKHQSSKGVIYATRYACAPILELAKKSKPCSAIHRIGTKFALKKEVSTVVISAAWLDYLSPILNKKTPYKAAMHDLENYLKMLKSHGKKVYLVLSIPKGKEYDPNRMIQRSFSQTPYSVPTRKFVRAVFLKKFGKIINDLKTVGKKSGVHVIDPLPYVCSKPVCLTATDKGDPYYKDHFHVRPFFVKERFTFIDPIFLDPQ